MAMNNRRPNNKFNRNKKDEVKKETVVEEAPVKEETESVEEETAAETPTVEEVKKEEPVVEKPVVEEVKKEKTVTEIPARDEKPIKPSVSLNTAEVAKLLTDPKTKIAEKLEIINKSAVLTYKSIVSKINDYIAAMGNNAKVVLDAKQMAKHNYDLYNLLYNVINTKDYNEFKVKMDIINLMFITYKDDALNIFKLHRADHEWVWGDRSLNNYFKLITLISTLANRAERDRLKESVSGAIKAEGLPELGKENLIKYYEL